MKMNLPKLLIVDDTAAIRQSLRLCLRRVDIEIHEASSGYAALEAILHHEFFAVLMDIQMPEMDGFETTALIVAHLGEGGVPIIFLTALHGQDNVDRCYEVGGIDYLTKPVNEKTLLAKIELFRDLFLKQERIIAMGKESAAMMESAGEGIISIDNEFNIRYVNSTAAILLEESKGDLEGQDLVHFLNPKADDVEWHNSAIYMAFMRNETYHTEDCDLYKHNAEKLPVALTLSPIMQNEVVTGGVMVFQDVSERKLAKDQLVQLAQYDPLTGLYNRMMFSSLLSQYILSAQRTESHIALHFIDLDNFKDVNDTLGHPAGDVVIKEAALRIKNCLRESDVVARLGGDEFGVIQKMDDDDMNAAVLAERIVVALQAPISIGTDEAQIGCSVGIALYPEHANNAEDLTKAADVAMYKSKDGGRNQYHFFTEKLNNQIAQHVRLISALKQALNSGEISLVYQPQIDLSEGRVFGVEALMRWHHKELGDIGPGEFIPIAERTGLLPTLGKWVLHNACSQAKIWNASTSADKRVPVSVNISGSQLAQGSLSRTVENALIKTGLEPKLLRLEIKENVLMDYPDEAAAELQLVHEFGVEIAIDDFGTGFSSMKFLSQMPLNYLNVGRSFIQDIDENVSHQKIVSSILSLAKSMDCKTLAIGVETNEQVECLQKMGCQRVQGYYYSKPLHSDDIAYYIQQFPEK